MWAILFIRLLSLETIYQQSLPQAAGATEHLQYSADLSVPKATIHVSYYQETPADSAQLRAKSAVKTTTSEFKIRYSNIIKMGEMLVMENQNKYIRNLPPSSYFAVKQFMPATLIFTMLL